MTYKETSKHPLPLVLVIMIMLNHQLVNASSICEQLKPTASGGPNLPYLLDGFQANVEANILNKNKTVSAKWYFDNPGNRATINLFEHGIEGQLIFNFKTDEIYEISGMKCTTNKFSTSDYVHWFGTYMSMGKQHVNDTHSALHFGKQFGEVYMGQVNVRGIVANHWKSCASIPSWNNFTVDYYFSVGNWATSSTAPTAPLKAEVKGTKTFSNGTVYNIHHVYDYFNYRPGSDGIDDTVFQTPANIFCPGRKQGKALPTLPKRFYYRTERVYPDLSTITFEDTWYDETLQLFRRDYHPLMPLYPIYTMHPLTEIHDYKTGVRYVIDKSYGNCTTTALSYNLIDTSLNITTNQYNGSYVLDLKNPLQLFHLNWNYTYIGQNTVRGILCDTYIAQTQNLTINGFVSNQNCTITFYFTSQEWSSVQDSDKDMTNTAVPVQMEIYVNEGLKSRRQYFSQWRLSSFDWWRKTSDVLHYIISDTGEHLGRTADLPKIRIAYSDEILQAPSEVQIHSGEGQVTQTTQTQRPPYD